MLIAFSAPQCSGKTTLLNECKKFYGDRFTYKDEIVRTLKAQGFKINQEGDEMTQLMVLNKHLENSFLKNAIVDRCILDGLVYTHYQRSNNKVDLWVYDYAIHLYLKIINKYNIIFYAHPDDVPLKEDGTRSVDYKFRNDIQLLFENYIPSLTNIVILRGTVEERMEIVKSSIAKLW